MRTIFCSAVLVSILGLHITSGIAAQPLDRASEAAAPADNVTTQTDWRVLIESLASHPDVLTKDWSGFRRVLPAGCFKNAGTRDLSCPPMDGVVRLSVDPGPLGIVDVVLKAPANCDQIYSLLSQRFGKGSLEDGDKCSAEWKLNRWVKRASVNLSRGRKDPSQLYLQFAIEQGP